ncbi:secreted RxLR effector protein 161-like [Lactuca sativa]|uniref:secreted RxLR effector protein 161-like n=1 Tax=Lactuca sativa TaxID=4236 RepID=UPI001C68B394|nr:secreted RxLR effector protein 161-like [Lactuca sativa]
MTDMSVLYYFLGIEVKQEQKRISISQHSYAKELLKRFNMVGSSHVSTPMEFGSKFLKNTSEDDVNPSLYRSLVGSLMYLTATRPNIMFSMSVISRFMENPKKSHWEAGKHILRCINGTLNHGLIYTRTEDANLRGFRDCDYGRCIYDSKSTTGYVSDLVSRAISWKKKNPNVVALSSVEAKYISLSMVGCQALWLSGILVTLGKYQINASKLLCDNKYAVALSKKPVLHGKSKHIRIKYHFRELLANKDVEVCFL